MGAGVFGTIPSAANLVGSGIEWAYVIAFLSIIVCYLPQMITISALPAPFTLYMHATRMVNPTVGYIQVIFGFNYVFILSALAGVFAEYAAVYIPIEPKILAVAALLLFAFITSCGVETNAIAQNIMVVCLFVALVPVHGLWYAAAEGRTGIAEDHSYAGECYPCDHGLCRGAA